MNNEEAAEEPKDVKSPQSQQPVKPKPFLARGSGKAGGVGKSGSTSKTPVRLTNK
jgi:hypothetical protein